MTSVGVSGGSRMATEAGGRKGSGLPTYEEVIRAQAPVTIQLEPDNSDNPGQHQSHLSAQPCCRWKKRDTCTKVCKKIGLVYAAVGLFVTYHCVSPWLYLVRVMDLIPLYQRRQFHCTCMRLLPSPHTNNPGSVVQLSLASYLIFYILGSMSTYQMWIQQECDPFSSEGCPYSYCDNRLMLFVYIFYPSTMILLAPFWIICMYYAVMFVKNIVVGVSTESSFQ